MALTKKHLEAFAAALNSVGPLHNDPETKYAIQWRSTVEAVADVCARFNHGFDRARFLKACGVEGPAHTKECVKANDRSATEICICESVKWGG